MNQIPMIVIVAGVLAIVVFAFLFLRGMRTAAFLFALLVIAAVLYFMVTGRTVDAPTGVRTACGNADITSVLLNVTGRLC